MTAPALSPTEYAKVRTFDLHRRPRFLDDGDGVRAGFVILAGIVGFLLVVVAVIASLIVFGVVHRG